MACLFHRAAITKICRTNIVKREILQHNTYLCNTAVSAMCNQLHGLWLVICGTKLVYVVKYNNLQCYQHENAFIQVE